MLPLAHAALRRPVLVLLLSLLATAGVAAGLFRLEVRADGAAIYPEHDATVEQTLRDREAFFEPDQIIVLVSSKPGGPRVASPEGFRFLVRTHRELRLLQGVDRFGVHSLADLIEPPAPGKIALVTFLAKIPQEPSAFADLLARIRRLPVASGLFLSRDGRAAPFYVPAYPKADRREVIREIESWRAARAASSPFELRITGPVAAESILGETVLDDLYRLVPIMVLVVALVLAVSLRTPGCVIVPLAQVLATLVWTFGLMGWAGVPITLVTTILPVLLMALSMTDEIHVLQRLRDRLAEEPGERTDRARLRRAAGLAYADLSSPLVLTSLTNAAGFFSFLGSPMAPLSQFGLFTGVGLMLALLSTYTLVPALIALLPPSWIEPRQSRLSEAAAGHREIPRLELWLARHSRTAALAGAALLLLALPGLLRLHVQDSWVDNFDPRSPLVTAERTFNAAFWGSYRFDVVLEGERDLFWTPRGAALLEEVDRLARAAPHVGGTLGYLQFLEVGAKANERPLPVSRLAPMDVMRAGGLVDVLAIRVSLRQYLTPDKSAARVRLFVPNADYAKGRELRAWIERRLPEIARRHGVRAHVSGDVPVGLAVVGGIVGNQLRSIGGTAVMILLTLLLAFRSPRWTLIAVTPVVAAALLLFAALGYAGLPLGIATSMFAAVTLGAGVDFALHYVHAYRRGREAGQDHGEAVLATLHTTGRGLLWNALVLAFGFSVLAFSAIRPNASLGFLLAAAMLASYATTVVFLPEILRRAARL